MSADPVALLARSRRLAVVGASRHPSKAAHTIPAELLRRGWDVVPVNPHADTVLDRRSYPALADVPDPVDLVVVFRPAADAPEVARAAVDAGARGLWLQLGIRSPEARRIAVEAGLDYVEDECTGALARRYDIRAGAPGSSAAP